MPSKTPKQAKLMRAVAHGFKPTRIKGPTRAVADEFMREDMKRKRGYQYGGHVLAEPKMLRRQAGGAVPASSRFRMSTGLIDPSQAADSPGRQMQPRGRFPGRGGRFRGAFNRVGQALDTARGRAPVGSRYRLDRANPPQRAPVGSRYRMDRANPPQRPPGRGGRFPGRGGRFRGALSRVGDALRSAPKSGRGRFAPPPGKRYPGGGHPSLGGRNPILRGARQRAGVRGPLNRLR